MKILRQDGETTLRWMMRLKSEGAGEVGLLEPDYKSLLEEMNALTTTWSTDQHHGPNENFWVSSQAPSLCDVAVSGMPVFNGKRRMWVTMGEP